MRSSVAFVVIVDVLFYLGVATRPWLQRRVLHKNVPNHSARFLLLLAAIHVALGAVFVAAALVLRLP